MSFNNDSWNGDYWDGGPVWPDIEDDPDFWNDDEFEDEDDFEDDLYDGWWEEEL